MENIVIASPTITYIHNLPLRTFLSLLVIQEIEMRGICVCRCVCVYVPEMEDVKEKEDRVCARQTM